MTGRLHLGTSGFAFPEWKGSFYPQKVRPADMLPFYAKRFDSVEINYSFRRRADPAVFRGWHDATPETFLFALKAPAHITHFRRLRDAGDAVAEFLQAAAGLGSRLGPVLFQCPPNLKFDPDLLQSFLATLPPTHRYAFEFRHPSWAEAEPDIRRAGHAWCISETDDAPLAADQSRLDPHPFVYLRLRRTRYRPGDLHAWAERIRTALTEGADVFGYVKHEEAGAGPRFARRLAKLVREAPPARPGGSVTPDRPAGRGRIGAGAGSTRRREARRGRA